jgi:large subunit ribosomal protein L21
MFAIFEDGSRQYRVKAGDLVRVDFRRESQRGDKMTFESVLCAATDTASIIGRPLIASAKVEAEVTDPEFKGEKIEGGKFKRRKGYIRHWGHTQRYTEVKITAIDVPGIGG